MSMQDNSLKRFRFTVTMPGRTIGVVATDKVAASHLAAAAWDIDWRQYARDMTITQISKQPVREKRTKGNG